MKKNPEKKDKLQDDFKKLKKRQIAGKKLLFKACGDWVTSANGWGLINRLTGSNVNDSIIGICGLVSSSIATYDAS